MRDVTLLLMGICDKCHSSEHALIDSVVKTHSDDLSVSLHIITGHCEACALAWRIVVRVIEVETSKM